jgi:hypothetical protein
MRLTLICSGLLLTSCSFTLDTRGKPCTDTADCAAGQTCRGQSCEPAVGDGDQCLVRAATRCVDGNVHSFNSCGDDEGEVETCGGHFVCRDVSTTEAACGCADHWQGDSCDICAGHFDPDRSCNQCLPGWNPLDDCSTCTTNRSLATDCTTCVDAWDIDTGCTDCLPAYSIASGCKLCVPNYDAASDCQACENHWDVSHSCSVCLPGYDQDTECSACLTNYDAANNCQACEYFWDLSTGCTACLSGYGPPAACTGCLGHRDSDSACMTCLGGWADVGDNDCGTCVRYVDAAAAAGGNGLSWATADSSLQGGIEKAHTAAQASGGRCQVWIRSGAYKPTSGALLHRTFVLQPDVDVYGGFPATGTSAWTDRDWASNVTTLGCSASMGCSPADPVYHVVTGVTGAVLDGVTIAGGNANGLGTNDMFGGGLLNNNASPTLRHCRFAHNAAPGDAAGANGGAIANLGTSAPTLEDCGFDHNAARDGGGAIYGAAGSSVTITGAIFDSNVAAGGMGGGFGGGAIRLAGDAAATITDATFAGNSVGTGFSMNGGAILAANGALSLADSTFTNNTASWGGALAVSGVATLTIVRSTFSGNHVAGDSSAVGLGGAVYLGGGTTVIRRSVLAANQHVVTRPSGGAIYAAAGTLKLINCVIRDNSIAGGPWANGGGVYLASGVTAQLINCTVYGNSAVYSGTSPGTGGGVYVGTASATWAANTIFAANSPSSMSAFPPATNFINNDIQTTEWPIAAAYAMAGNKGVDPAFVGGTPYDLHLTSGSPCKDTGTGMVAAFPDVPDDDLEGTARPYNGSWDMGAYEYAP